MRQRDQSTATIMEGRGPTASQPRLLLDQMNIRKCQVVTFRRYSATSEGPAPFLAPRSPGVAPPNYLADEIALREWLAVAPALEKRGLLDETMRPLLAGYCNALARSVRAEQILAREGRYYRAVTRSGSTIRKRHPAVQDAEEGWASVRHFARLLGISPCSTNQRSKTAIELSMFK